MNFYNIGLDDIQKIRPYLEKGNTRLMDLTVGGIFMWRDYMNIQCAIEDGTLFLTIRYPEMKTSLFLPVGENRDAGMEKLLDYCKEIGQEPRFVYVTDEELEWIKNGYAVKEIIEDTVSYDYFYSAESLRDFSGRKYHTQKNHINKFMNTYTDYEFEEINSSNIAEVTDFYIEYAQNYEKESAFAMVEGEKVFEVLENPDKYGFFGILLRAGGRTVAFSLGEKINDTLFVSIEKADKSIPGAYQMTVREFARRYTDDKVIYINRGDDAGDEGLRQSKQSYHPIAMLKKNIVVLDI